MELGYKLHVYFSNNDIIRLIKISDLYVRALAVIGRVYAESLDKSGNAMTGHFTRVSDNFEEDDERIVGLLHDIVEDKKITLKDLLMLGFPSHIVEAVNILSRDKKVYPDYDDYVTSVIKSENDIAIRVKYADMLDNSSPFRLEKLEDSVRVRLTNKYKKQLPRLEQKVIEINNKENVKKLERKIAC